MTSRWPSRSFVASACTTYLFLQHIACLSLLEGPSMLPTFNFVGDVVLVDKILWKYQPLEVGSIYAYISPQNPDRYVIKRIVGRPGDVVFVDPTVSSQRIKVPVGCVWTCGDNYVLSNDSRVYGPVPIGLIQGKLIAQVWPTVRMLSSGLLQT